ncbi:hypothetical protein [Roseateles cavernae]|uniref:hypothetical protein n=1 Tax=Roseateles cavernae TaxID=3153578 RepID=UPI0032E3A16E
MKLIYSSAALLLLSACAGTSPPPAQTETAAVVAEAKPVCFEDAPTGTRFTRTKCVSAAQDKARQDAGRQAADELSQIRRMPTDMK